MNEFKAVKTIFSVLSPKDKRMYCIQYRCIKKILSKPISKGIFRFQSIPFLVIKGILERNNILIAACSKGGKADRQEWRPLVTLIFKNGLLIGEV